MAYGNMKIYSDLMGYEWMMKHPLVMTNSLRTGINHYFIDR